MFISRVTVPLAMSLLATACLFPGAQDSDAEASTVAKDVGDTVRHEAEARSAQSGCAQKSNHGGYTGSGFMDYGNNGTWIEWNRVAAPEAGEYRLDFRYANARSGARSAEVLVDGQRAGSVSFGQVGDDWDDWGVDSLTVRLTQGNHTIRVRANSGRGGPNLDHMDVTAEAFDDPDLCPNDPNKDAPGECGCGVPEGSCGGGVAEGQGLTRAHYNGTWSRLPDFDSLTPDRTDVAEQVTLGGYAGDERFGLLFTGFLYIETAGAHDFELASDDGSRLYLDGDLVVDHDGLHGFTAKQGRASLDAGWHPIRVEFFERSGGDNLRLRYRRGGAAFAVVPGSVLARSVPASGDGVCEQATEGGTVRLACPSGETIRGIEFASYGSPTGSCADLQTSSCHAENSLGVVEAACLGRNSCSVAANNGTFGDPCRGTRKNLSVRYVCSAGGGGSGEDGCPDDPDKTQPGQCGCGVADTDSDGDGRPDCNDSCPTDQGKFTPGQCGCGVADVDGDGDGRPDCQDGCPDDRNKVEPLECGCGVQEGTCGGGGAGDMNPGLSRAYYSGAWNAVPDFDAMPAVRVDVANAVELGPYDGDEQFGLAFRGSILIDAAGSYDFELGSDDGSRLWIDGQLAVNNDGLHGYQTRVGTRQLGEGLHTILVEYFDRSGGDRLSLRYRETGGTFVALPADILFHDDDDVPEADGGGGGPGAEDARLDRADDTKLRIASWNNHRGSIFPKTTSLWRAINRSGKYHVTRTEGAARIIRAVDADIWLMQETVYSGSAPPSGISENDINRQLESYMEDVTGDSWRVSCNARGLCAMLRGNIRFDGTWERGTRVMGHRVILPDNSKALLVNLHYMNSGNAVDTRKLIESVGPTVSTVFVGGDFNDGVGGNRYNEINNMPGMNVLSMEHWKESAATHVSAAMATRRHTNTKGYVMCSGGPAGQDLVTNVSGGLIDHFFLQSDSWRAGNRFILNTLLLTRQTLGFYDLRPLDVALQPQYYFDYFDDFMDTGVIRDIPVDAYDHERGIHHDHLPMIVDFTW